ncbi:MAG: glycerol-3-phosphate acyltransferase [Clostridiales bacterium]|nr:glycerol-3-phosphate acyltransferase [Clostridiales bacterium]
MEIKWEYQILVGVLVGVLSYLLGNVNTAIMISKLKGKDIRTCGSGNPGTMNMLRTFGKPIGALTLVLDVLKGVIPSLLGWLFMGKGQFLALGSDRIGILVGGICVEIGHIYPVFMKFKGGKGIATVFGVCMVCRPIAMLISFAVGVLLLIYVQIGSLTSFILLCAPLTLEGYFSAGSPSALPSAILVICMFSLTLFAHRSNLVKLFSGCEGRVVLKKSKKPKKYVDRSIAFEKVIVAE